MLSLLLIDVVWAGIAYFGFTITVSDKKATRIWGLLNFFTSAVLVLIYLYCDSLNVSKPAEYYLQISTLVIIVIRTVIDYCLCWSLYYPNKDV